MILNLYKHDYKKMSKILNYMYVITLAFALVTRIVSIWENVKLIFIIKQVLAGFTIAGAVNIIVNTFVHILKNVITSFYKDESYLTHTLPVSKTQLLVSKYLSAITLVVVSVLVCFISLVTVYYSPETITMLKTLISATLLEFNMSVEAFIVMVVLLLLFQTLALTTLSFVAIIKGYSYNEKRILFGLIWFFVIYIVSGIVMLIVSAIILALQGNAHELLSETISQQTFKTIVIVATVCYALYSVVYFFTANKLFNKGVNVD